MLRVRLNELLQQRGMSQRELARRIDKHPDVVSRFAREMTGMVSYDLLDCVCNALGCEVSDLLEHVADGGEQIGLFESQGRSDPTTMYARARPSIKAAERKQTYGESARPSGGAA